MQWKWTAGRTALPPRAPHLHGAGGPRVGRQRRRRQGETHADRLPTACRCSLSPPEPDPRRQRHVGGGRRRSLWMQRTTTTPLTYTLDGLHKDRFTIVSTSGQIRTKAGQSYDHDGQFLSLKVVADDGNGGTATADVTVFLTDQVEPPLTDLDLVHGPDEPLPLLDGARQTGYTAQFGRKLGEGARGRHRRDDHRPGCEHSIRGPGPRRERRGRRSLVVGGDRDVRRPSKTVTVTRRTRTGTATPLSSIPSRRPM